MSTGVTAGKEFYSVIGGDKVLFIVDEPLSKGYWLCHADPDDEERAGLERAFHEDEITIRDRLDAILDQRRSSIEDDT
jgi:hypothetical protein